MRCRPGSISSCHDSSPRSMASTEAMDRELYTHPPLVARIGASIARTLLGGTGGTSQDNIHNWDR